MNTKQYLKQAFRLNELIDSDLAEIENLRSLACSVGAIRYDDDKVQNNPQGSKIESLVTKIVDLEQRVNQEIDTLLDLKTQIRDAINGVENPNQKLLLRLRYVEFRSWPEIQKRMGLEERNVYKLHSRALMDFRLPENFIVMKGSKVQ